MIVSFFRDHGYHCSGVFCSEDVDAHPQLKSFDILIVDINLPGENGLAFVERLRAANKTVGVIIMSGSAAVNDRINGYRTGADIYLPNLLIRMNCLARFRA